jgi:hypothetical protein
MVTGEVLLRWRLFPYQQPARGWRRGPIYALLSGRAHIFVAFPSIIVLHLVPSCEVSYLHS